MDYARKIGKSDEPKKWVKQFTGTVSVQDNFISQDRNFTEDRRLINWKKWLTDRKKLYKRIEHRTDRNLNDQAMNSCETIRPLVEMRNLMDYANIPVPIPPDKHRGGPEFWRTLHTLSKHGDDCLPDLRFTPNKKELNLNPGLMYVDLPELVEKEKGFTKFREPLWKRSQYLKKRREELSTEIKLLVPKEPETRNLVIQGHRPRQRKEHPRIPPITVSDTEEGKESQGYPDQAIVLRIQDKEIHWQRSAFKNEQIDSGPITWNVTFSSKIHRREEKEIIFENKGNRVIVYQWRDAAFRSNAIPVRRRLSPFFFNKTKEVIPPGQIVKLKIWYRPKIPGIFSEYWRLQTDPKLCPSPLIFRFWGYTETLDTQVIKFNPVLIIDEYLDRCIRDTTIRDIINDIIEDIDKRKPPEPAYGSLFLESEIFLVKNPLCFYHPGLLIELHKIYYTVTNQKEKRWNSSLDDLREILLKIEQPERRHNMLLQFSRLYKECLVPTLYNPVHYNKHEAVCNLFGSFFNRFEIESKYAKGALLVKESKEHFGTFFEMDNAKLSRLSQTFAKSNDSRNKYERKLMTYSRNDQAEEMIENFDLTVNDYPYREIFFIRIHEILNETIERILATIDSFNNLTEGDK